MRPRVLENVVSWPWVGKSDEGQSEVDDRFRLSQTHDQEFNGEGDFDRSPGRHSVSRFE
jgi:hypothetical protein